MSPTHRDFPTSERLIPMPMGGSRRLLILQALLLSAVFVKTDDPVDVTLGVATEAQTEELQIADPEEILSHRRQWIAWEIITLVSRP